MPGQRTWIVLLIAGVIALAVGVVGVIVGGDNRVVWLVFGAGLLVASFVGRRRSRRLVQESMRLAAQELRGDSTP